MSHGGSTPEIAVLVPSYGSSERLARLLGDLARQTLDPDRFEVIVVDDGSPEPLEAGPTRFAFTLLRQDQAGPAAARNRAIEVARAPLALILNDDARPAATLLAEHLAAHADAPPQTAVLGAFPFSADARRSPFVRLLAETDLLFEFPRLRDGEFHDWRFFWTCNLSLPLEALRAVGGFDAERFRDPIVEDVELGYRLQQQGFRVLYRASAVCEHDHVITLEGYLRRSELLGVNLHRMWCKHGDPEILGVAAGMEDAAFQALQLELEKLVPVLSKSRARLERLEREFFDRPLDPGLLRNAADVLRLVRLVPLARGIVREQGLPDPIPIVEAGARPGAVTSVVMVSHESLEDTRRTLEALRDTSESGFPLELIVVDNGSKDGSVEYLAAQPDVRLIENRENVGAPRARNQGVAHASGDWVVFLDNDALVFPGWLARLRYHAEVDGRVGCVVPVSDRAAHGQQIERGSEAPADLAAERARSFDRRAQYKTIFSSLCVLVRREVLDRIGGFDERFSPWGFEDDDFSLRVHLAGYRTRMALDVFVHHPGYAGPKGDRHRKLLLRNWRRFVEKWGGERHREYGSYGFLDSVVGRPWTDQDLSIPLPGVTGGPAT